MSRGFVLQCVGCGEVSERMQTSDGEDVAMKLMLVNGSWVALVFHSFPSGWSVRMGADDADPLCPGCAFDVVTTGVEVG